MAHTHIQNSHAFTSHAYSNTAGTGNRDGVVLDVQSGSNVVYDISLGAVTGTGNITCTILHGDLADGSDAVVSKTHTFTGITANAFLRVEETRPTKPFFRLRIVPTVDTTINAVVCNITSLRTQSTQTNTRVFA